MQPGYSVPYFEVDPVVYERMRESVFAQKKRMLIQPTHAGSSTNASLTRTSRFTLIVSCLHGIYFVPK